MRNLKVPVLGVDEPDRTPQIPFGARTYGYSVAALCVVYTLSCLDRNVINILAEPIKRELNLQDWQLGALSGIAFALFYTVLGVPLARFSDRFSTNRVRLISISIAAWSVMTALCGAAGGFGQLALARLGVGVGEAGAGPSAHALIADLVPPSRRASAMSVYALGIPLGSLLGLSLGGVLALHFGWRIAFAVVGLPGLLVAGLVWATVPEPRTGKPASSAPARESFGQAQAALSGSRVFTGVTLAAALMTVLAAGQGAFLGSLLIRVHGLNVAEAGVALGLTLGGGGLVGSLLGGFLVDRFAGGDLRRHMTAPIVAVMIGSLFFIAAILQPTAAGTLVLLAPAAVLTQSWFGPAFSAIQRVTPPQRRATAAAVHAFIVNLVGVGLGPFLVGLLSDGLNRGMTFGPFGTAAMGPAEGLRYALLVLGLMPTLAALAFWRARARIRDEVLPEA